MPTIEVKNLSKTYEVYKKPPGLKASLKSLFWRPKIYVKAVKAISFQIKEGELVGFLGPNGAGKTTTLKMLSGILHPSEGEIRVLGYYPWRRQKEYQKQFSLVMGQKNQLWWDLPAMESLILNKEIYEVSQNDFEKTLNELAHLLEVKDLLEVPVRKLSLGERMKCELIAALLHSPKVLFLDEPTIGLDVVSQKKIRDFIKDYNQEKKTTILLTSHYMDDITELCQRVIIINLGKIIYDGNLQKLIEKYAPYKLLTITFHKPIRKDEIEHYGRLKEFIRERMVLEVPRGEVKNIAVKILTSDLPIDDILIDEVEVEEVIREIFGESKV